MKSFFLDMYVLITWLKQHTKNLGQNEFIIKILSTGLSYQLFIEWINEIHFKDKIQYTLKQLFFESNLISFCPFFWISTYSIKLENEYIVLRLKSSSIRIYYWMICSKSIFRDMSTISKRSCLKVFTNLLLLLYQI